MKKIMLVVPDEISKVNIFLTGTKEKRTVLIHDYFDAEDFSTVSFTTDETEVKSGLDIDIIDCADTIKKECVRHSRCVDCRFYNETECMLSENIPELWEV